MVHDQLELLENETNIMSSEKVSKAHNISNGMNFDDKSEIIVLHALVEKLKHDNTALITALEESR